SARNGEIPKFQKPLFGTTPPSALSGLVVQTFPNKMGVPVKAPTDLVWAYGDGKMVVAPRRSLDRNSPLFNQPNLSRQGEFKIFKQKVQ
ncbi:hypothetical protein, partial [Xanthomonas phaseoli]|uniref:hypothetical protein n=2 Tax=Xanthomonas phaseoli TaxID=1985254 RepID=UPI0012675411